VSPVEFVSQVGAAVGVDIGGSNCRFIASDLLGNVLRQFCGETPTSLGAQHLAGWVVSRVRSLVTDIPLRAVAIGLPGVVHPGASSSVWGAPNLPQVEGEDFVKALREQVEFPVIFDNDSNFAVLGEMRLGAARGRTSATMLTIGTGLGAGVVVGGQLLRGDGGFVGEFGYIPVGADGEPLEQVLSARWLVAKARQLGIDLANPAPLFSRRPPRSLSGLRRRFEQGLLLVLSIIASAYDPEVIVLGGGVSSSLEENVLPRVGTRLKEMLPISPVIAVSQLGDVAGAIGALVLALHEAYVQLGVERSRLDGYVGMRLAEHVQPQAMTKHVP
jgi:predicted NBD/HSP70 family sugar kinase